MSRRLRVLMLVHPKFRPDRGGPSVGTERDVYRGLRRLGAQVEIASAEQNLREFERRISRARPQIVFNLLEEFAGEAVFDFHPVTWLEMAGVPYTGCNPRGLIVTRNKHWVYQIARSEGVPCPSTRLVRGPVAPRALRTDRFPVLVKFAREHASLGLTKQSVVRTPHQLRVEIPRLKRLLDAEILVQEFVPGREVTVRVWGNRSPRALPPWELRLRDRYAIATERIKFNARLRRRHSIRACRYLGPHQDLLSRMSRRLFAHLDLNGYARFDYRVPDDGVPRLIDVNANPNLAVAEDFARSARRAGYSYLDVLNRVIHLGRHYSPRT